MAVVPRFPGTFGSGASGMRARFQSMVTSPATATILGSTTGVSAMTNLLLSQPNHSEPRTGEDLGDGPDGVAVELLDVLGEVLPRHQVRGLLPVHVLLRRVFPAARLPFFAPPV